MASVREYIQNFRPVVGAATSSMPAGVDGGRAERESVPSSAPALHPKAPVAASSDRRSESSRRGISHPLRASARGVAPVIPRGDVWLDKDVAAYLHVCLNTVKRIMKRGPNPGELDLRKAKPVLVGDRRWYADNVKALLRDGVVA